MSERFWEVMCAAMPVWGILFGLNVVLLVFVVLSLYLTTPQPGSAHILAVNAVLILVFLGFLAATIRKCRSGDF